MPSKRTFDLIVLTTILVQPVKGLFKMWSIRKASDPNAGVVSAVVAGATRIAS